MWHIGLALLRVEQKKAMAFSRVKIVLDSREKVQSTLSKGDMQKGNNQLLRFCIGGLFKC